MSKRKERKQVKAAYPANARFTRCPYCKKLMLVGQVCPYNKEADHQEIPKSD